MLILKRKIEEEVYIGRDIKIKILDISENQVKIGFYAPESIEIFRSEIFEKIKEINQQAKIHSKEKVLFENKFTLNKISQR
ncbi:carbon storage regulator CsrA [Melioribacteraceae bacterium 4301-Me]|uniref:carbon storage regulator CsrA n=1 Tax=Pyranulibacter aquaticus TaxID=3163344 RepID=UPI0035956EDA